MGTCTEAYRPCPLVLHAGPLLLKRLPLPYFCAGQIRSKPTTDQTKGQTWYSRLVPHSYILFAPVGGGMTKEHQQRQRHGHDGGRQGNQALRATMKQRTLMMGSWEVAVGPCMFCTVYHASTSFPHSPCFMTRKAQYRAGTQHP